MNHASYLESLKIDFCIIEFEDLVFRKDNNLKYLAIKFHRNKSGDIWGKDFSSLEILIRAISEFSLKNSLQTLHIGYVMIEEHFVKGLLSKYSFLNLGIEGARESTKDASVISHHSYLYSLKDQ